MKFHCKRSTQLNALSLRLALSGEAPLMPFGLQFITLSSSKHCSFVCCPRLAACSNLLLAKYNLLAIFVWAKRGTNIPNVIIDQSTNQIWPSEIPRSTNYYVSTSPDPPLPLFSLFLRGQVEGLGTRLDRAMRTCVSSTTTPLRALCLLSCGIRG